MTRTRGLIVGAIAMTATVVASNILVQRLLGDWLTWGALSYPIAFLVAQMLDVGVFDRLRGESWWRAPLVSSLVGSAADTAIFFTVAFSGALGPLVPWDDVSWANELVPVLGIGREAPLWVSLALADFAVKMALALLALAPFRAALAWMRPARPDSA